MKVSRSLLNYLKHLGIADSEAQRKFLLPQLADHHDPFLLEGIGPAVVTLADAVKRQRKILIWGDADLDGISSTALLKLALGDLGASDLDIRIPPRGGKEFGLVADELKEFKERGGDLIVTVDVGLTNVAEAAHARRLGLDLIITDHHEAVGELPLATLINPKLPATTYPFRSLAGAGVVLKLVTALYLRLVGLSVQELADLRPHYWVFAALGTISDRCPLVDENRLIVREGLAHLRKGGWLSLAIWLDAMGLDARTVSVFDLYSRGISIFYAPDPEEGVRILLSEDGTWLKSRYAELKGIADAWQRGKQRMIEEAKRTAQIIGGVVVSVSKQITQGYLGTAAHALRGLHRKPAIVFAPHQELWRAECRGLEETDLLMHLAQFKDLFITFGGHRKACGFTMSTENVEELLKDLSEHPIEVLLLQETSDKIVELDIKDNNLKDWMLLAPFGEGNPPPHLLARGVRLQRKKNTYLVNDIPVYLPFSLRNLSDEQGKFDMEYTINGDGSIRVLALSSL